MSEKLNKLFEENIKNNIKSGNYDNCIGLLKSKIIDLFSIKIRKVKKEFKYTSLEDMLDVSKGILSEDELYELYQYYSLLRASSPDEFKLYNLLEIYKKIK